MLQPPPGCTACRRRPARSRPASKSLACGEGGSQGGAGYRRRLGLVEQAGGPRAAGLVELGIDARLEPHAARRASRPSISLTPFHSGSSGSSPRICSSIFTQLARVLARAGRDDRLVADLELVEVADQRRARSCRPPRPRSSSARRGSRAGRGSPSRRCSNAFGQRGWNEQPSGGRAASGISPRGRSRGSALSGSGSGIARISACVYGCLGSLKICVDGADLDDPAEVHDRHAVAEELRARQVVRDVDVRQPEPRA